LHTELEPGMIACVCNDISDRDIRQAVELDLNAMAELRTRLGVGTCCGQAGRLIRQANASMTGRLETVFIASHNRSAHATARRRPW
jgi:bacterioferritin-associated ferredoxin